jgi:hypothetical protein
MWLLLASLAVAAMLDHSYWLGAVLALMALFYALIVVK